MAAFTLADDPCVQRIERLSPQGQWQLDNRVEAEIANGRVVVTCRQAVPLDQPLFLTVF